jgi:hypothetical protein
MAPGDLEMNDDLEDLVLSKAAEEDARNGRTVNADDLFEQLDLENSR